MAKNKISKIFNYLIGFTENPTKAALVKTDDSQTISSNDDAIINSKVVPEFVYSYKNDATKEKFAVLTDQNVSIHVDSQNQKVALATTKLEADNINRSFRQSDSNRYDDMDFVVGININLSNNLEHNCDLCRFLAGKYPKSFNWEGWHDGCMCHTTTISFTRDEMDRHLGNILDGRSTRINSINEVKDFPSNYKMFVALENYLIENYSKELIFNKGRNGSSVNTDLMASLVYNDDLYKKIGSSGAEKEWKEQFSIFILKANKAIDYEKSEQFQVAIDGYLDLIEYCEKSSKISHVKYFMYFVNRVRALYRRTKQKNKMILFLEGIIQKYDLVIDTSEWQDQLKKLSFKPDYTKIGLNDITKPIPGNPTLGKMYDDFKSSFPEFNFYFDKPDNMDTTQYVYQNNSYPVSKIKELYKYQENFKAIVTKAKAAEASNDLKMAIEEYERLVCEEYESTLPYERLMVIYSKLKWFDEEKRIINHALSFFKTLKNKQFQKTISIAKKFGMETKALEYINENKKIYYYAGLFELYNPFPIIEKWQNRLKKISIE